MSGNRPYGVLAEFAAAKSLMDAVIGARREAAFKAVEAYSPFPVEGLDELLERGRAGPAPWMLLGGLVAGLGTLALEYYSAVIDYPLDVGGRPAASWVMFVPPAAEMCLLGAAVCGVAAMLIGSGLPRLHHPLFGIAAFERASSDRFFLLLRADEVADMIRARRFLETLSPVSVSEVLQ
jgi:hypothetical protein